MYFAITFVLVCPILVFSIYKIITISLTRSDDDAEFDDLSPLASGKSKASEHRTTPKNQGNEPATGNPAPKPIDTTIQYTECQIVRLELLQFKLEYYELLCTIYRNVRTSLSFILILPIIATIYSIWNVITTDAVDVYGLLTLVNVGEIALVSWFRSIFSNKEEIAKAKKHNVLLEIRRMK